MNMEPYELAENVTDGEEAVYICAEILRRQWILSQPEYAQILDKIPGYVIKQYLSGENNGSAEDAHKQMREKITEEIRKIEEDDIMQQPPALVDVNAPVALMQCTRTGRIQGLKLAMKLLDEEENGTNTDTDHDDKTDC